MMMPWWVLGGIETHNSPDHVFSTHQMEWPNEYSLQKPMSIQPPLSCTALTQVEKLLATNQTRSETHRITSFLFFFPYFWIFFLNLIFLGVFF
jgi:hypothetical protein